MFNLNSIAKYLQREATTHSDVLALFGTIMEQYETKKERLSASGAIVEDPKFESAVIKLQRQIFNQLDEKRLFWCNIYDGEEVIKMKESLSFH